MLRGVRTFSRYGLGVSAQRSGSAVAPDQRSAFPGFAGVPGWSAVLIAVTLTLAGFAIEAGLGHRELGTTFAVCFAVGCVGAVLAVERSGLFAAMVQPPLLLFVAIPTAYYLLQGGKFNGLKDALITCGYPLIERFPLMLTTSAAVLAIGLVRWYAGKSHAAVAGAEHVHAPKAKGKQHDRQAVPAGLASRIVSTLSGSGGESAARAAERRNSADRARRADGRPSRTKRKAPAQDRSARKQREERLAPSHARHGRPSREEQLADGRTRTRRRPDERAPRDVRDYRPAPPPHRGPRPAENTGSRQVPPPPRRDPRQRPSGYGPPEHSPREGRREGPRPAPRDGRRDPRPVRGYDQPYPPRPDQAPAYPPRRRPEADPRTGAAPRNGEGYHPVSRVRYRSDGGDSREER